MSADSVKRYVPRILNDYGMIEASEVAHYTHLNLKQFVTASDYDRLAAQLRACEELKERSDAQLAACENEKDKWCLEAQEQMIRANTLDGQLFTITTERLRLWSVNEEANTRIVELKQQLTTALTAQAQAEGRVKELRDFIGCEYDKETNTFVSGKPPYLSAGITETEALIAAVDALRLVADTYEAKFKELQSRLAAITHENAELSAKNGQLEQALEKIQTDVEDTFLPYIKSILTDANGKD